MSCRRASSAARSGFQAYLASRPSSTRKVTIVQMKSPGSGWTRGLSIARPVLLEQHDEQAEDLGEDRDPFEQEEREVHRADDLLRRRRLPRDAFGHAGGQFANAQPGADDREPEPQAGARIRKC